MWRKHATPCFRYVYVKVVRFRCIRSNGNARKRHETGNGNTGYPSCFRNGLTCFCHVSVYGFSEDLGGDHMVFGGNGGDISRFSESLVGWGLQKIDCQWRGITRILQNSMGDQVLNSSDAPLPRRESLKHITSRSFACMQTSSRLTFLKPPLTFS